MNAEVRQQLYGGEIGDYIQQQKYIPAINNGLDGKVVDDLASIYNSQIKGKPSINTAGIISTNGTPPITRDPYYDKIGHELTMTLNNIARDLDLHSQSKSNTNINKATSLLPQTNNDIAAANDNVLKAMEELRQLKAI